MTNRDLAQRLVLARGGWCVFYRGAPGDALERGGTFNDEDEGAEKYNFLIIDGRIYGYVHGARDGLKAVRVAGSTSSALDDICVAMFATHPEGIGQVLVGWYRHASATNEWLDPPRRGKGIYSWSCAASDATLLPVEERRLIIPKGAGGSGQAQVTYARDKHGAVKAFTWIDDVRRFISCYKGSSLINQTAAEVASELAALEAEETQRVQSIVEIATVRSTIEKHAMKKVKAALKLEGYKTIEDVSGFESFDYLATKGQIARKIEVKGTRSTGEVLLFSLNEARIAESERIDLYIVQEISVHEEDGKMIARGGVIRKISDWGRQGFSRNASGWQVIVR